MRAFGVDVGALPYVLNSSHTIARHVCVADTANRHKIDNATWKEAFTKLRGQHGALVDIRVKGVKSPCRADLYLFARDGIVSVEFKYVKSGKTVSVESCVAQMRRYARHRVSILVMYAAGEMRDGLEASRKELERRLRSQRSRVFIVRGPEIARVRAEL